MVFLILLFLYLFFPHPIFADSNIKITDFSSDSSEEWILLKNNGSDYVDLTNWYFTNKNNTKRNIEKICISPGSSQVLKYSNFLKNGEGNTIYLFNSKSEQQDMFVYTESVDKTAPESDNTCKFCEFIYSDWTTCSSSATQTRTYTSSPDGCFGTPEITTQSCTYTAPTNTPTPDPTITNPPSGISMTEFMPYSDPEWIEIYNDNDYPVKLVSWKVEDLAGNTKNIDSLSISAKGYAIYELKSLIFDNNSDEKVILRNQENKIITQTSYSKGQLTLDRTWSYVSGSWCQASITKGYVNVTSCYTAPTPTGPTATPTSDPTKYIADDIATESAIIEPKSESSFITPTVSSEPSPTTTSNLVLGDSTSSATNTSKKNYLPLILIIFGGGLLISPAIITKIKSKK